MPKFYNLAFMTTATTGTGTITLGSAMPGFLTFAQAGVQNGDVVGYAITDGSSSEIGTGTYTASGTTLTRTVLKSTNSDSAINLSGGAKVLITASAADVAPPATAAEVKADSSTTVAVTPGRVRSHPAAAKSYLWLSADQGSYLSTYTYNVSSVADTGTGDASVTMTNAHAASAYCVQHTLLDTLPSGNGVGLSIMGANISSSVYRMVGNYFGEGSTVTFYDTPKAAITVGELA